MLVLLLSVVIFELTSLFILCFPLFWELEDDKKGDSNKAMDVVVRTIIAAISALMVYLLGLFGLMEQHGALQAFVLSLSIHFLIFDYAIAALLGHKDWFSYLGKKGVIDNLKGWKGMKPALRFTIRMIVFAIALVFYFYP